jgi:hypothetical protein
MTLPYERTRAVVNTHDFLVRLLSPYNTDGIKRIPKAVREEALWLLRHYPMPYDIYAAAKCAPDVFDEQEILRYNEGRHSVETAPEQD